MISHLQYTDDLFRLNLRSETGRNYSNAADGAVRSGDDVMVAPWYVSILRADMEYRVFRRPFSGIHSFQAQRDSLGGRSWDVRNRETADGIESITTTDTPL